MKKIVLSIVVLLALITTALSQDVMVVNDQNAELRSITGSFHGISVSSAIDVVINQGNEEAVVVSASEEKFRRRIKAEVKDGILRIWYDNEGLKINWGNYDMKLRAYVSVKNLDKITVSGACDVKIDGVLKGNQLSVALSGASSLKGEVEYKEMTVEQSGASDSKVKGKVGTLNVEVSGASDFKGFDLVSQNCIANASGASDVQVTVEKDLKVSSSGASDVEYKGQASVSNYKTSGGSSIKKRN
jgi:uncharacterized protein YcfL/carbon monoxide dehydrogenase subunit G